MRRDKIILPVGIGKIFARKIKSLFCFSIPGKSLTSSYKCQICSALLPFSLKSDHLTVHFKDKISPLLSKTVPFNCPKCRYVAVDRAMLIRHFATRHGLLDAFLKDWLEKNDRKDEAVALEVTDLPETKPLPERDSLECRLCEDFPVFSKNFDFHKHLTDTHFRLQINQDLPQVWILKYFSQLIYKYSL